MSSGWLDNTWDDERETNDGLAEGFYCPFTNGAVCPVISKGWQPQELCSVLECEQLQFIQHKPKGSRKAA